MDKKETFLSDSSFSESMEAFKVAFAGIISGSKADYDEIVERCKKRQYAEQGIPVFLVLEDLTTENKTIQSGDKLFNLLVASAMEIFAYHFEKKDEESTEEDIGKIIEYVAAKYFVASSLDH